MLNKSNIILPKPIKGFEHISRYWDRRMQVPAAKILPGECYVSGCGELISTVLGSCVAACVRDKRRGIGGMNHFMLPIQSGDKGITRNHSVNPALCYGNWAMEFLINSILKEGGKKEDFEVKLFGGGRVLSGMTNIDIGGRNIEFVRQFLQDEGLRVVSQDLGGDYPRKVLYFPDTGAVKMKKLRTVANTTLQKREKAYYDSMAKKPQSGDVELF